MKATATAPARKRGQHGRRFALAGTHPKGMYANFYDHIEAHVVHLEAGFAFRRGCGMCELRISPTVTVGGGKELRQNIDWYNAALDSERATIRLEELPMEKPKMSEYPAWVAEIADYRVKRDHEYLHFIDDAGEVVGTVKVGKK